jgi:hypothetical protein
VSETPVVDAIAELRNRGYLADFAVTRDGRIGCGVCGDTHAPADAIVDAVYRFEGMSDPDDEAVVFGLTCRACGTRGVLVTAYGPAASAEEASVVAALAPHA